MRIAALYSDFLRSRETGSASEPARPIVSFEFSPPRTDAGFRSLLRTIAELKPLRPSFVSVTMGAGGSTRRKTVDLVTQIQREIGLTAMAHLPCIGFERSEIESILDQLQRDGLENVLALGGDPPRDQKDFVQPQDGFTYANELVDLIRSQPERWPFSIGGGCYPEVHPRAADANTDLDNLVRKVEAGADFLITQLFFDNADYFAFVEKVRARGVEVPIIPGLMPIVSASNIRRMAQISGARIPTDLENEIDSVPNDDDERVAEVGIAWATMQCRELFASGVPGIHFYTLNRSPATRQIYQNLFGTTTP